jgi:undecaprenyl pyrophosphate phosphatase UppP
MTQHNQSAPKSDGQVSGEMRLKKRKRAFWMFVGIGCLAAAIAGFASGFVGAKVEQGMLPDWAILLIMAVVSCAFIWFSYTYYKKVDELDLTDNLWANTFGLYAYVIMAAGWVILQEAGIVGPPQHWPILIVTLLVALIAYTARRLGLR